MYSCQKSTKFIFIEHILQITDIDTCDDDFGVKQPQRNFSKLYLNSNKFIL